MSKTLTVAITILAALSVAFPSFAEEKKDTAFASLYERYMKAYNEPNSEKEFYQLSKQMMDHYLAEGAYESYYNVKLNESLYDAENGHSYNALKKANAMLEEIKKNGQDQYDKVYTALGSVYDNRSNMRMAKYFYNEALKSVNPTKNKTLLSICSRLAFLDMLTQPEEAVKWNKKYEHLTEKYPEYKQVYYYIDAAASLASGRLDNFRQTYEKFCRFHEQHKEEVDNFGVYTMDLMAKAANGEYDNAISLIDSAVMKKELSEVMALDMHAIILQMAGRKDKVIEISHEQRNLIDSLNSDMFFNNLNEINAQTNLTQTKYLAAKKTERMAKIIIALALIIIVVLIVWMWRHRMMRKHLIEKNEQLKTALAMAEESDRMKTEFVRQVSHEIRTPLNAIMGFNEILNTPGMTLSDEERQDLLARIKENTKAITNIVDEVLQLSDQESADYSTKKDQMLCNRVLSDLLYRNRSVVSPAVDLSYTTEVINRFTIHTNEESVKKIVDHLIQNAIKFTTKGIINLHCRTTSNDQMVEISLTDTGRGISPENRSKIFDQFVKEDSFQQGMGLGLTVSQKIAQKLGGDLKLDEDYTDGARFVLTLPVE